MNYSGIRKQIEKELAEKKDKQNIKENDEVLEDLGVDVL